MRKVNNNLVQRNHKGDDTNVSFSRLIYYKQADFTPEILINEQPKAAKSKLKNNMTEEKIQLTPEQKLHIYNKTDDNKAKEENTIKEAAVKAAEFLGIDQFELLLCRA